MAEALDQKSKLSFDIATAIRSVKDNSVVIGRVRGADLLAEFNPTEFRFATPKAVGKRYLHLVKGDNYISIKISDKISHTEDLAGIAKLLTGVIYTGESANGRWFVASKEGELASSVTFSAADVANLLK